MLWHTAFGIEKNIDALLSPTHLLLFTGGLLVLTAPLRAAWAGDVERPTLRAFAPALLSATLATALAAFFLLYASPFAEPAAATRLHILPEGDAGHLASELPAIAGLTGYLVTTCLLVGAVLLLLRRWELPFGSVAVLVGVVATFTSAATELTQPLVAPAAILAGLCADAALARVRRRAPGWAPLAVGAALPTALWSFQLAALAVTDAVRWPAELWTGAIVLSALAGAGVALLVTSGRGGIGPSRATAHAA